MTTKKQKLEFEKKELIERLQKELPYGSVVYGMVSHVSSSGMMRVVKLYYIRDGEITQLHGQIAGVLTGKWNDKHYGITVAGCGFDAIHSCVSNLAYELGYNERAKSKELIKRKRFGYDIEMVPSCYGLFVENI